MQTAPTYPQNMYSMAGSAHHYYPSQSYADPRTYNPQYLPQNLPSNSIYPSQYNQPIQPQYPPNYGAYQRNQPQYYHPEYQYTNQYASPGGPRQMQRVQYYNYPTQHKSGIGSVPRSRQENVRQSNQPVPKGPLVHEVVYEEQPLNIPEPIKNVQYIPQLNKYMDYVEQRVKIPKEKYYTDYYEIEHVTDFVPREYEESVIQMVPEEIIKYRLEYVPVQRKIVHLPKNQLYDQNGLYKGVGTLADRVHLQEGILGAPDEPERKQQGQISRTIYERASQINSLNESLVEGINKDVENQPRTDTNINRAIYEGMKNIGSPSQPRNDVSRTIYGDMNESASYRNFSQSRLPQNQMLDAQLYGAISRNVPSRSSRASRKRTNFVTSDGYFPNYEQQLRNFEKYLSCIDLIFPIFWRNLKMENISKKISIREVSRLEGESACLVIFGVEVVVRKVLEVNVLFVLHQSVFAVTSG